MNKAGSATEPASSRSNRERSSLEVRAEHPGSLFVDGQPLGQKVDRGFVIARFGNLENRAKRTRRRLVIGHQLLQHLLPAGNTILFLDAAQLRESLVGTWRRMTRSEERRVGRGGRSRGGRVHEKEKRP